MADLGTIANQINTTLSQIQTNTSDSATTEALIKGDTADLKTKLDTLIAQNQTDFANLSAGIAKMIDEQKETNYLLNYQRQQNDTVICWLTNIANMLCCVCRDLNEEIEILGGIRHSVEVVKEIEELVHGTEAVEVHRGEELREKIRECCKQPKPEPKPCFEPCQEPGFTPYPGRVPDYNPLPQPQNPNVK